MNIVVANGFGMEQCSFYSEEYHCCVLHNTRCKCEDYNPRSKKPTTNYDLLISKTPEELANWLYDVPGKWYARKEAWLDWLTQEADQCTT